MADNDRSSSENQGNNTDYNKMNVQEDSGATMGSGLQTDRDEGRVGSSTLPESGTGSGTPPGGMNTSSSTVSAGGTTGGGTVGAGATTDRGSIPISQSSTQSGNMLERQSGGAIGGQTPSTPQPGEETSSGQGSKGSSPLSPEEADKINQDVKSSAGAPEPDDVGHERY